MEKILQPEVKVILEEIKLFETMLKDEQIWLNAARKANNINEYNSTKDLFLKYLHSCSEWENHRK